MFRYYCTLPADKQSKRTVAFNSTSRIIVGAKNIHSSSGCAVTISALTSTSSEAAMAPLFDKEFTIHFKDLSTVRRFR